MPNARFGHFPQPRHLSAPDRVRQRCFALTPPRGQEALGPVTAASEETRFALLAHSGSRLSSREPREAPALGSAPRRPATGPRVPPAPYPRPHPRGCRDPEKAALLLRGGQRRPRRCFTSPQRPALHFPSAAAPCLCARPPLGACAAPPTPASRACAEAAPCRGSGACRVTDAAPPRAHTPAGGAITPRLFLLTSLPGVTSPCLRQAQCGVRERAGKSEGSRQLRAASLHLEIAVK